MDNSGLVFINDRGAVEILKPTSDYSLVYKKKRKKYESTIKIGILTDFNSDFILVSKKGAIPAIATPSGTKWDQYLDWIHDLPEEASPHWIGLSPDADLLLKEQEGIRDYVIVFYSLVNSILKNLKSFQALLDENQVHNMSNGATPEKFRSWLRIIPEVRNIQEKVDLFFKAFCFVEFRYQNTS